MHRRDRSLPPPVGGHISKVLAAASPLALDELITFARAVASSQQYDRDLSRAMSALALDASAALGRFSDVSRRAPSRMFDDALDIDPAKVRTLVVRALEALGDEDRRALTGLVEEHGVEVMPDPSAADHRIIVISTLGMSIARCPYAAIASDVRRIERRRGNAQAPAR